MSQALLRVENLSCERGYRTLFDGLNFTVPQGQLIHIAGENGAGKSTLLKVLAGLSSDFQGQLFWKDKSIETVRDDFLLACRYLGHAKAVKQRLTIEENLRWSSALYQQAFDKKQFAHVIQQLQLTPFTHQLCGALSAGQQQRVALARLLLCQAQLWILDEPFTALDKVAVVMFEQLIQQQLNQGVAIIITSHQPFATLQAQQVIQLGRG